MPSTVRVSDLAKEVGLEPGELLRVLQADFGVRARTVSSSIPDGDARKVRNRLRLQQRRASRPDRRLQAAENIRRAAEQRLLRDAAEVKARGEAERRARERAREEAEKKAQEEAEARAQAEEAEAQRQELERAAAERKAEEERQAAEAAARRAAEARKPETARKLEEQAQEKRTVRPTVPETPDGERDGRRGRVRDLEPSARLAAASAKPAEPAPAKPPSRRIETRSIASSARPSEFRPGATDRKIVPTVIRPARRATPPRIRATPPPMRRTPAAPPKLQRPGLGRRSKGRRRQGPAETPEVLDGFDSQLPPGLRQAVSRESRTNAKIALSEAITVKGLAEAMSIPTVEVIKALLLHHGLAVSINQPLDAETASKLVRRFGGSIIEASASKDELESGAAELSDEQKEGLVERAPVVTVMGHVGPRQDEPSRCHP